MSILLAERCAGADAPRTLVSGLLNGARLRAPIAERLSKFYLPDPEVVRSYRGRPVADEGSGLSIASGGGHGGSRTGQ